MRERVREREVPDRLEGERPERNQRERKIHILEKNREKVGEILRGRE